MNREYLVELAMDAYAEASGQSVYRPHMEAAFDAIAAEIWDEAVLESCAAACGCLRARHVPNTYDTSESA